ncbi:MAG: hypothetical protein PHS59_14240 [Paludibacter sp.]|nr:hypothetical protein [Paludibacter sp.]
MENLESIEQVLDKMDISTIKKQVKSPVESILILIAGFAFLQLNFLLKFDSKSVFPPMFFMIAFGLFIWGILSFLFRKKYYFNTQTKQKLKTEEVLIDVKERDKLVRIMNSRNYEELKSLKQSNHDGLKLRYMTSKDGSICFSQVISFVSLEFVNITTVQIHKDDDAKNFLEYIKMNH